MEVINNPILMQTFMKQFGVEEHFSNPQVLPFRLVRFGKDELLMTEGELPNSFICVLLGTVSMYALHHVEGDFRMIEMAAPMVLGEESFLTGEKSDFYVKANTEVLGLQLEMSACRELLQEDYRFYRYLCEQILMKNSRIRNPLKMMEAGEANTKRVLAYLQITAGEDGKVERSLGEISEVTGLSYRQLIRIMNKLCEEESLLHGRKKGVYFLR